MTGASPGLIDADQDDAHEHEHAAGELCGRRHRAEQQPYVQRREDNLGHAGERGERGAEPPGSTRR